MGYVKIAIIGSIWVFTLLTSLKGWYKLVWLVAVKLIPPLGERFGEYVHLMLVSDDQDIYTLLGGSNPDITISDRIGRECVLLEAQGFSDSEWHQMERVVNKLFAWQPNHCRASLEPGEEI